MSQAVSRIKTRIKSVTGAYKVTSAMKLVSNVKLKQWRNKMLSNKEYIDASKTVIDEILRCSNKCSSPYLNKNERINKKLYIVVSSTLGLCGSYNTNIFKLADAEISKNDEAIVLGGKGVIHFKEDEYNIVTGFENVSSTQDKIFVNKLSKYILSAYQKEKYSEIHLIYSEYKNSMVFLPKDLILLPLKNDASESKLGYPPILEPSAQELVDTLVPNYIKSLLYSKLLESNVCEEAARSNAMENATNNASEILDELKIEFNKARQSAITQEIIEIVSASKAV